MATLKDTSALKALNEQDYVNKLYDSNNDTTKQLLQQNYTDNTGYLNNEQNRVQQQTQENVNRTQVEAQAAQNQYNGSKLSAGASQQEALSRGNAQQANTTDLQQKQSQADMEIERQRQLLASQYSAAIKQAQADNDMQKAQMLYNAAKAEEEKLMALKQSASTLMVSKNDTSIRDSLLAGETPTADFTGDTWEQVLKNEAQLNEIYNKKLEAEQLGLQMENEEAMSDLAAKQREGQAQTDEKLTQAYVDALKKAKNYAEVQTAYGQGSGTAAQAKIAQDTELQKALTDLRGVQMGADADIGMKGFDLGKTYRQTLADKTASINKERAEKLFEAAEKEEDTLYETQLQIGQELAKNGDYSVLGKLYGLTDAQIAALTPKKSSGGGGSSSGSGLTKKQQMAKEVALATVRNSTGAASENSAYWNSQKTQAYYGKK
jgi:hypothetical protein